jgi:hypothetical protein
MSLKKERWTEGREGGDPMATLTLSYESLKQKVAGNREVGGFERHLAYSALRS